jgi:hypothetical protein
LVFWGVVPADGRVDHTHLRLHWRYRRCERRANYDDDLIKEKIVLTPIQIDGFLGMHYDNRNDSVYNSGTGSCCIDLLVCRGADKQTQTSIDAAG